MLISSFAPYSKPVRDGIAYINVNQSRLGLTLDQMRALTFFSNPDNLNNLLAEINTTTAPLEGISFGRGFLDAVNLRDVVVNYEATSIVEDHLRNFANALDVLSTDYQSQAGRAPLFSSTQMTVVDLYGDLGGVFQTTFLSSIRDLGTIMQGELISIAQVFPAALSVAKVTFARGPALVFDELWDVLNKPPAIVSGIQTADLVVDFFKDIVPSLKQVLSPSISLDDRMLAIAKLVPVLGDWLDVFSTSESDALKALTSFAEFVGAIETLFTLGKFSEDVTEATSNIMNSAVDAAIAQLLLSTTDILSQATSLIPGKYGAYADAILKVTDAVVISTDYRIAYDELAKRAGYAEQLNLFLDNLSAAMKDFSVLNVYSEIGASDFADGASNLYLQYTNYGGPDGYGQETTLPALASISATALGMATEGSPLSFVVKLDKVATQDVTFTYSAYSSGVTSADATDFTTQSGTATLFAGASEIVINVDTTVDNIPERLEFIEFKVSNVSGATVDDPSDLKTRGYIVDKNSTPLDAASGSFAGTVLANEATYYSFITHGTGTMEIGIQALTANADLVILDYLHRELPGSNMRSTNPGTTDELVSFQYSDNQLYFIKVIGGVSTTDFGLTLVDKPQPIISIRSGGATTEGGQIELVANASFSPLQDVTFSYSVDLTSATSATALDFNGALSGTVTIPAGHQGPFVFSVGTATADSAPEGIEFLNVNISNLINGALDSHSQLPLKSYILDGDSTQINFPDTQLNGHVSAYGSSVYSVVTDGSGGRLTVDLKGLSADARVVVLDYRGQEITSAGFQSNNPGLAPEQVRIPYGNTDAELYFIKIIGGASPTDYSLFATNDPNSTNAQALYDYNSNPTNSAPEVSVTSSSTEVTIGTNIGEGAGAGTPQDKDVFVSSIVHTATVKDDSVSEVIINVKNTSNASITNPGKFFVALSDDDILDQADQIVEWQSTYSTLAAHSSIHGVLKIDWANLDIAGSQFLIAGYFNSDDPVQSNNYLAKAVNVVSSSFSDMTLLKAGGNFANLSAGDAIAVSTFVRNNGDISSGSSTLNLLVNNGSGWVQIDSIPLANLSGGSVAEARLTGALPNGFSGAVQTKVVVVNGSDRDTTNNELSLESFYVDPLPVDDIGVAGLAVAGATEYSGAIDTITDTDTFNISVVSGGVYRFEISEYDLVNIHVIDQQRGRPVGHHSVDGVQGGGVYIFQAVTTGTYALEISSNGAFTGGYTLAISGNIQDVPVQYTNIRDFVTPNRYVSQIHDLMDGDDIFTGSAGSANYTVYGGLGDDGIWGGSGNDKLYGGEGIDNLFGGSGDDYLSGGNKSDYIQGGRGNDRIFGGTGNDSLYGDEGYNYMYGGSGDDHFGARAANSINYMDGGTGWDLVDYLNTVGDMYIDLMLGTASGGAAQGDTLISIEGIYAGTGNDTLIGNDANNFLYGGVGNDTIFGGFGDDRIYAERGDDKLYGGAGSDYLAGSIGVDEVHGGDGDDLYVADGVTANIYLNRDVFYGDAGEDTVKFSGAWADYNFSINGDAVLITDSANMGGLQTFSVETFNFSDVSLSLDRLLLGSNIPVSYTSLNGLLEGGQQSDWIVGAGTSSSILGGTGDDQIIGNSGPDTIDGGAGSDSLSAGGGDDIITDPLGDDTVDGGTGHDQIILFSGTNSARGGAGNDIILGGIQGDQLFGDAGNDVIVGDIGSFGGADIINGGTGDDIMMGGIGEDTFVFAPNDGTDTIADFNAADVIFDVLTGYTVNPIGADFQDGIDHIQLNGFNTVNVTNVKGFITDTTQGAVFSAEGTTITFYGVDSAALSANDFLFV